MKRLAVTLVLVSALALMATTAVSAKGNGLTQAKVEALGWTCFPGPIMVHCVHPNTDLDALISGELPSVPSLNFSLQDGSFNGTEVLIRADLGADERPCRQGTEPDGTYEAVDFSFPPDGIPEYYSCHHNNDV